jgi:thymidylate synthase (FAD)
MKLIPMKIEEMGLQFLNEKDLLSYVGNIAGECYNSSRDLDACVKRALNCIKRGHHTPFEHAIITLKCTVDRGVSHALVRHRHCAFQQSSTIYQKFDEIECIDPLSNHPIDTTCVDKSDAYRQAEIVYHKLLNAGEPPSSARDVLPNALATNLIITTNVRQWMYMIQRRCGPGDSDNMHQWCAMVRAWFEERYPQLLLAFDCWYQDHPL